MRIVGIDPGLANCGFGVLDQHNANTLQALEWGAWKTSPRQSELARLDFLYQSVADLVDKHQAEAIALEQVYFARNISSAMAVGEVVGVIKLLAQQRGLRFASFTALEIKQTIACYGKAAKMQMQRMVQMLLRLEELPNPDHAADALGVAIHYAQYHQLASRLKTTQN